MKKTLILIVLLFSFFTASAQHKIVDSLRAKLNTNLEFVVKLPTS